MDEFQACELCRQSRWQVEPDLMEFCACHQCMWTKAILGNRNGGAIHADDRKRIAINTVLLCQACYQQMSQIPRDFFEGCLVDAWGTEYGREDIRNYEQ